MYSKQQASQLRREFWTRFGLYMRPLAGADGSAVNWLNYKTGIKDLYFRLDANNRTASVSIELRQPDNALRNHYFEKLLLLKTFLEEQTGEEWNWQADIADEDGRLFSRVNTLVSGVNIFNKTDWPLIISFLKPRMLALDRFWYEAKDMLS